MARINLLLRANLFIRINDDSHGPELCQAVAKDELRQRCQSFLTTSSNEKPGS